MAEEKFRKILSFPSPVPSKADYQRVKASYTVGEIRQLFGLSERVIRRWTRQGIVRACEVGENEDYTYDFQALTQFRRVREMRGQGLTIKRIETELQGQMSLFLSEAAPVAHLLTPFEEALLLHERDNAKAEELYREAINEGDNIAEAYCNLGLIELDRGNISKAIDNFSLSLSRDPRHVEAHYNLANLYYDVGNLSLAKLHYEAAIQIEPGFPPAYFNLALVFYKLGDIASAASILRKYREIDPTDEEIKIFDKLLQNKN